VLVVSKVVSLAVVVAVVVAAVVAGVVVAGVVVVAMSDGMGESVAVAAIAFGSLSLRRYDSLF
jgi:hypothetical protein